MTTQKTILLAAASLAAFFCGFLSNLGSAERFDHEVRNDYFAGFSGNAEALERAMKKTEAVLAADPKHAEAMVWHGSGLFFLSGQYFRKGDQAKGTEFYGRGIGMMKQAVALEPKNIGVRIPRGAVLLTAARQMPPQLAEPLREDGLSDYLVVYAMQKDQLEKLGTHPRGELLIGIADSYSRKGEIDKASEFFDLIERSLPNTPYARSAAKWKETKQPLAAAQAGCFGCHASGK